MRNLKRSKFFSLGRKWIFTLALFLLVFSAATAIKIQAQQIIVSPPTMPGGSGSERELSGWIWGGSEDFSIGGVNSNNNANCLHKPYAPGECIDGNETGVGWISVNSKNCDTDQNGFVDSGSCGGKNNSTTPVVDYNVYIDTPSGAGNLIGYGWSENLGWIKFDPDLTDQPVACNSHESVSPDPSNPDRPVLGPAPIACPHFTARLTADGKLEGWARVVGIANDSSNGGWGGWISLSGKLYSVSMDGAGKLSGYGWNGENVTTGINGLGAFDYRGVSTNPTPSSCALSFIEPPSKGITLSTSSSGTAKLEATGDCKDVALSFDNNYVTDVTPNKISSFSDKIESIKITASNNPVSPTNIIATSSAPGNPSDTLKVYINSSNVSFCSCGSADGKRYCSQNLADLANSDPDLLCSSGVESPLIEDNRGYTWNCGSCPCSASKICGWIETNP